MSQQDENRFRKFLKDRLLLILIVLFVVFIWPTPFETRHDAYMRTFTKVWRFTGTPAPWE